MSAASTLVDQSELLCDRDGSLGWIRLNRPHALNSLTLGMIRRMQDALDSFEEDPEVAVVLVTGEGERGLCAGGDIRAIYESGRDGSDVAETFWREEYQLDARISHFPKPYVVVMDGIVMGGGVGISAHGRHRIVTERTRLAMLETGIGYIPDVGASWFLPKAPGELGTYIGLTGDHLAASDIIAAGLADHFVPSSELSAIPQMLSTIAPGTISQRIDQMLKRLSRPAASSMLATHQSSIDRLFAFDSVEEIVAALETDISPFASKTRDILAAKSPTSLKLALRMLRLGRQAGSLEECLEREFSASVRLLAGHDFREGIRAAVIEKDRNPRWSPVGLDDVTGQVVEVLLSRPASLRLVFEISGGLHG